MNAQNAETYLPCYRPGKPMDARTLKAARYAERDETLRRRLAEQMSFDEQMVSAIHFIQPPENLRQKLHALGAPGATAPPTLRSHLRHPAMLSALAGVLLFIGLIVVQELHRRQAFPGREATDRMLATTSDMSGVEMEPTHGRVGDLGDAFYMRGFEGFTVPESVAQLPVVGMRIFRQNGHRVAQLAVDAHDALVFVFNASDFGVELGAVPDWRVWEQDQWAAAIRSDQGTCTMIAFRGDIEEMKRFLQTLR
jgi:hypothetical protein